MSSTLQDIWSDLVNGLGISNQQYRDAADLAKLVQEKLGGGAQLSFTGHSLGGGLASTAAAVTNLSAKTFNAASTDAETIRLHGGSIDGIENRVTAYYVGDDILSNFQDHLITKIITLIPNTLLRPVGNLLVGKLSIMPGWMPSAVGTRSMIAPGGSHSNLTVMAALQNRILDPGYYAELK